METVLQTGGESLSDQQVELFSWEWRLSWRTWIPVSLLFLFSSLRLSGEDGATLGTEEAFTCSESEWQLLMKKKKRANGQALSRTALQKFLCLLCAFGGAQKRPVDGGNSGGPTV